MNSGIEPAEVIDALSESLRQIGRKYETGDFFLSELMMAAILSTEVTRMLQPHLVKNKAKKTIGKVAIGTVKGDIHDIGNIAVDNLAKKDTQDIAEETKDCIRKASPGGGHILSSSNSWASGAKLENCLTMVETGRKFGIYPITVSN